MKGKNAIILTLIVLLTGCEGSNYRKSLEEIDAMADDYPAQARLFLSRADSNANVAYYNLIAAKIEIRQKRFLASPYDVADRSIEVYRSMGDSAGLACALYYKGVMLLYCSRDTLAARETFEEAELQNGNRTNKTIAELYNTRCLMGDTALYISKLRKAVTALGDTTMLARSYLYEAMAGKNEHAAEKAFTLLDATGDENTMLTAYHEYVRSLIDRKAPDSLIMRYLPKARTQLSPVAHFTIASYLYDHPHPSFVKDYLQSHGVQVLNLEQRYYFFGPWTYAMMANMYFVAKQQGDQAMADSIVREMRPLEYSFDSERAYHDNKEVELMYEGGHTRFMFNKTIGYVMYGVIAILLLALILSVLYIRRIKRTNRIILSLNNAVHQLKDIENPQLAERCDQLSHEIEKQLRRLRRRDSDIEGYKQQIQALEEASSGLVTYARILQDENISQIGRKGINLFLESYKQIDGSYSERLADYDLNPSEQLFCVLYHLGKTDEQVMQILQYSLSNIRVRKSRIKTETEAGSFDELITK